MAANVRGGTVKPHVQAFADATVALGATSWGTYEGHQPTRDRALDLFVQNNPVGKATGDRITSFALDNWRKFGLEYVIFRRFINSNDGRGWRQMPDRGSPTANHMDHVHASFKVDVPGFSTQTVNYPVPLVPTNLGQPIVLVPLSVSRALDVPGNARTAGQKLGIWELNAGPAQLFRQTPRAANASQIIVLDGSELVIDERLDDGTVQLWPYHGRDNQQWVFEAAEIVGVWRIKNVASGRYLGWVGSATQTTPTYFATVLVDQRRG